MIYTQMKNDMKASKTQKEKNSLRVLMSAICEDGKPIEDQNICLKTLDMLRKGTRKNIELYGGMKSREDWVNGEKCFLDIIDRYMPAEISDDMLREIKSKLGLESHMKNMKTFVAAVKEINHFTDGNRIKNILLEEA